MGVIKCHLGCSFSYSHNVAAMASAQNDTHHDSHTTTFDHVFTDNINNDLIDDNSHPSTAACDDNYNTVQIRIHLQHSLPSHCGVDLKLCPNY